MSTTAEDLKRRIREAGTSAEALRARIARAAAPPPAGSADAVFSRNLALKFANNVLAVPSASGDLLAAAAAGVGGTAALLTGRSPEYRRRFADQQEAPIASTLRSIPRPKVQDLAAGMRAIPSLIPGGESPGEAFSRHRESIAAEDLALREAHPIASLAGDVAGDALSIAAGRAPIARVAARGTLRWGGLGPGVQTRAAQGAEAIARVRELPPGVLKQINSIWSSKAVSSLRRGAGRAAETGIEGAALAVLNEGDPLETAAWGAGAQAGGSALLTGAKGMLSGGLGSAGIKIGTMAFAAGSLLQLMKEAVPGGRDRILESMETGYSKVLLALAGGALSGLTGAGRLRGYELEKNLPIFADALTSLPRGSMLSLITDLTSDDPRAKQGERILDRMNTDPGAFTEDQLRELNRAFNDGKFLDGIERLAKNDTYFRGIARGKPVKMRTGESF